MSFKDLLEKAVTYNRNDIKDLGKDNIETLLIMERMLGLLNQYNKHMKYQSNGYYIYDELQVLDDKLRHLNEKVQDILILLEFAPVMDINVECMNILLENTPYILEGCSDELKGVVVKAIKALIERLESDVIFESEIYLETFREIDVNLRKYIVTELYKSLNDGFCESVNKHYLDYIEKAHNSIKYLYLYQEQVIDKEVFKEKIRDLKDVSIYRDKDSLSKEILFIRNTVISMLKVVGEGKELENSVVDNYVETIFNCRLKVKYLTNVENCWQ